MSWNFLRQSIVKKTPGKDEWCVESESGKNMGCSDSPKGAKDRLAEVEMFKHMKNKRKGATEVKEYIPGGNAEGLPESCFPKDQLAKGKEIEKEHSPNPGIRTEISKDHLAEFPDYYDRLEKMEYEAKAAMEKNSSHIAAGLGTHGDGNDDMDKYPGNGFQSDTDLTDRDKQTHPNDLKNPDGVDPGFASQREHNETMLTDQVMPLRGEYPKRDFQDQVGRISEEPAGEFHDSHNKVDAPKEGEVLGLVPSYSAAELYLAITPRQEQWSFKQESLFDTFIGNVGQILADCKAHGASRAASREAVIKIHSALFAKHEWMSPILNRFLDRTYGTTAKPKSALSTLEGCISDFVVTAHKNGWDKRRTLAASRSEFFSWIDNYPDTQDIIDNKVDAVYGVSPEIISKFMTTSNAGQAAITLRAAYPRFPIPYAEFRRWCSAQKVPVPTLYELERIAMELNYITMPETLVVFSEKDVYVSDDKTKTVTQERPADPNQQPDEMKLADGTTVTRTKKITE